jgi:hypothetical protein
MTEHTFKIQKQAHTEKNGTHIQRCLTTQIIQEQQKLRPHKKLGNSQTCKDANRPKTVPSLPPSKLPFTTMTINYYQEISQKLSVSSTRLQTAGWKAQDCIAVLQEHCSKE